MLCSHYNDTEVGESIRSGEFDAECLNNLSEVTLQTCVSPEIRSQEL